MHIDSDIAIPEPATQESGDSGPAHPMPAEVGKPTRRKPARKSHNVLVIDIGGTHIKVLAKGQKEPRKIDSGPTLTAAKMASGVKDLVKDWDYDVVTIGYPGVVVHGKPLHEPHNLGQGWVNFNYEKAFNRPVRVINDAAMQALGSYDKKESMLFLGLGTGLGSAMIANGILQPMELAHLPYKKGTYEDYVGLRGLEHLGKKKWRREVANVVDLLRDALEPDEVVLGGGNAFKIKKLPAKTRLGNNNNAFLAGFRVWEDKGITLVT